MATSKRFVKLSPPLNVEITNTQLVVNPIQPMGALMVAITQPTINQIVSGPLPFVAQATVSGGSNPTATAWLNPSGTSQIFPDSTTSSGTTWTFTWNGPLANGAYMLAVQATDSTETVIQYEPFTLNHS
jgi:hypothetical protein